MTLRPKSGRLALFVCCLLAAIVSPLQRLNAQEKAATDKGKIYYGVLDVKVRVFRFVITVDGDTAKLKSLDEGGREFDLSSLKLDDSQFNFELKASKAKYESSFDKETKTFKGEWKQGFGAYDLEFKSVDKVPADPTSEIWEGELNAGGRKMVLRFRVYENGDHQVLLDSPNERVGGFTGTVEEKEGKTIYTIPAIRGKFTGKLSDDKSKMKGTWNQGVEFPMEMKKVSAKEMKKDVAAPKRPQTPKAPFPYVATNVTIQNKAADLTLAATLTIPKQGNKFPCAILISGSGAQDRDETLMDHKPFWVIADHLSRNGIACLRFDDRGTAKSTGDHSTATSQDFATDVLAIVDFLKTQPKIDATQIGLCGHSEGGLIGPIVAAQRDDVAFVVMLAGPGVNGEKILKNQLRLILKATGAGDEDIEVASFLQNQLIDIAKTSGKIDDEKLSAAVDKLVAKFPSQEKEKEQILNNAKVGAQRLAGPWMQYFLTYEPGPTLEKVKCPVFAINGSKDTQVDPKLNFPAIRKAFENSGKKNFEIVLLDNLNHLFQNCETGALDEYQSIEETFDPNALKLVSDWILKVTK